MPRDADPETLIRAMTREVIDAARADRTVAAGGPAALRLAEEKVFPLVDFEEATRLAVGRAWSRATRAQQERLTGEFRALLIRTVGAGQRYEGQEIRVLPVRLHAADTDITVHNQYLRAGAPPLRLDYQMHRTPAGWRIYDIVVEGVSLVLAYRSEFEQVVRDRGVEALIERLAAKNGRGA
jgi:phospholipid transport system substrate-binding protein